MRKEAAGALEEMFQQADKERVFLFAVSGFRSLIGKSVKYNV